MEMEWVYSYSPGSGTHVGIFSTLGASYQHGLLVDLMSDLTGFDTRKGRVAVLLQVKSVMRQCNQELTDCCMVDCSITRAKIFL